MRGLEQSGSILFVPKKSMVGRRREARSGLGPAGVVWAWLLALPQGTPLGAGAKGVSCSFSFPGAGTDPAPAKQVTLGEDSQAGSGEGDGSKS